MVLPPGMMFGSDALLDPGNFSAAAVQVLKPLQTTPGHERRPPNKRPAVMYFSPPTCPLLSTFTSTSTTQPARSTGCFIINVETSECAALVKAAEAVGLLPDEPVASSAVQLSSMLAHNLIWLVDTEFISTLYQRIVHLLPQTELCMEVLLGGSTQDLDFTVTGLARYILTTKPASCIPRLP